MKESEIIVSLNEILSQAEIYEGMLGAKMQRKGCVRFSRYFERIDKHYCFVLSEEHADLYRKTFWGIFNTGSIKEKYTIKYIENQLNTFLIRLKVQDGSVDKRKYSKFYNKLNMATEEKVSVIHPIYGVAVTSDEPLSIGCFTLYNSSTHKEKLLAAMDYQSEEDLFLDIEEFANQPTWISTQVQTVDLDKAYELACDRFEVFQGVCQFILDLKGYNAHAVCILNDVHQMFNRCLVVSSSEKFDKFNKDIRRFKDVNIGVLIEDIGHIFVSILERLFVSEKNEINNRTRNAFTTYGRIIHEHTNAQKLVMYITVIESLIEYNSPDLTEEISSYISAMLCDNLKDYEITKEHFKFIYNLRSEISHGSRTNVLGGDLAYAKAYCAELILKYITDKEIEMVSKSKDLKAVLESKVKRLEVLS